MDLVDLVHGLGAAADLPVVEITVPGAPSYATSNARARELLEFRPRIDVPAMIDAAAAARKQRLAAGRS